MPQRHSKNNTDSALFSYHERKMAGYGTLEQRVGGESQLPFGYCCLTLKPVEDPVVTPSGHVYSREAIMSYLLTKTQELKRQRAAFEAQQREAEEEAEAEARASSEAVARRFMEKEGGTKATAAAATGGKKDDDKRQQIIAKSLAKVDQTSTEARKADLKRTSFWLPEYTPEAKPDTVDKPDKRPRSPMTGRPLRVKELLPVNFMVDPEWKDEHDCNGKYLCAVSRKQIVAQPVVMLTNTGVVMLESVLRDLALPDMTCPVTGKKFKEGDVLPLVSGGSSFSAVGQVQVKKYRPTRF